MTCNVKIQLLHPDAKLPTKAHPNDAAYDVVAVSREFKDGYIQYKLGFATEIPDGWEAKIYPRSSISKYDMMLCNGVATIDAGFRGEWLLRFKIPPRALDFPYLKAAFPTATEIYEVGDRIAQIQFQRVPTVTFEQVESLEESERGVGGFGSTNLVSHA